MNIYRIDFEYGDEELSFLYDDDEMTEEQVKDLIYNYNGHNTDKYKGFFLPTSKADLLREWVNDFKNK